jgi:uncharacterized protein YukJ
MVIGYIIQRAEQWVSMFEAVGFSTVSHHAMASPIEEGDHDR